MDSSMSTAMLDSNEEESNELRHRDNHYSPEMLQSPGETSSQGTDAPRELPPINKKPLDESKRAVSMSPPPQSLSQARSTSQRLLRLKQRDEMEKYRDSPTSSTVDAGGSGESVSEGTQCAQVLHPPAASPRSSHVDGPSAPTSPPGGSPVKRIYRIPSKARRGHHHHHPSHRHHDHDDLSAHADATVQQSTESSHSHDAHRMTSPRQHRRSGASSRKLISPPGRSSELSPPSSPAASTSSGTRYLRRSKSSSGDQEASSSSRRKHTRSKSRDKSKSRDRTKSPTRHRSLSRDKSSSTPSLRHQRAPPKDQTGMSPMRRLKGSARTSVRKSRSTTIDESTKNSSHDDDNNNNNSQRSSRTANISVRSDRSRVRSKAAKWYDPPNGTQGASGSRSRIQRSSSTDAERRSRRSQSNDAERLARRKGSTTATSRSPGAVRRRLSRKSVSTNPGTPGSVGSRRSIGSIPLSNPEDLGIPPPPPPDEDQDDISIASTVNSTYYGVEVDLHENANNIPETTLPDAEKGNPEQQQQHISDKLSPKPREASQSSSRRSLGVSSSSQRPRYRGRRPVPGGENITTNAAPSSPTTTNDIPSPPTTQRAKTLSPKSRKPMATLDDLLASSPIGDRKNSSLNSLPEPSLNSASNSTEKGSNVRAAEFADFGNKSTPNVLSNHFREWANFGPFSGGMSVGSGSKRGDDSSEGTRNLRLARPSLRKSRSYGDVSSFLAESESKDHERPDQPSSMRSLQGTTVDDFFFQAEFEPVDVDAEEESEGENNNESINNLLELDIEEELEGDVRVVRTCLSNPDVMSSFRGTENDDSGIDTAEQPEQGEYLQLCLPSPTVMSETSEIVEEEPDQQDAGIKAGGLLQRFTPKISANRKTMFPLRKMGGGG